MQEVDKRNALRCVFGEKSLPNRFTTRCCKSVLLQGVQDPRFSFMEEMVVIDAREIDLSLLSRRLHAGEIAAVAPTLDELLMRMAQLCRYAILNA